MWPLKRLPRASIAIASLNGIANFFAGGGVKCAKVFGWSKFFMELGVLAVVNNGLFPWIFKLGVQRVRR